MEPAFADALTKIGHEVVSFAFQDYFHGKLGYYQSALPFPGPALVNLNRELLKKSGAINPDLVLVWNGTHVLPRTLRRLKAAGILLASYNNDDPFGHLIKGSVRWHHRYLWRWYLICLKYYDVNFVYRPLNLKEAISFGARNVHVLKPYFIPYQHRPFEMPDADRGVAGCDVVFIGHYEPDGREEYLRALVTAGVHVRLYGGKYWTREVLGDMADYFGDISPVYDKEYVKALCGAKICLSFLSKMNRDTFTRRCFEIPACGRLLLCERTDDMKEMFTEGEEAVYFSSAEELVEKVQCLLLNPLEIVRIAEAGQRRVWADGHDVVSRAQQFMELIASMGDLMHRNVGKVPVASAKNQGEYVSVVKP